METITLNAHFDGKRIVLDEPYDLEPEQKLLVSLRPAEADDEDDWRAFSLSGLERGYGDDEPEYTLDDVRELNPSYEGK